MSSEPISLQDIENIIKLIREAENVAEFSLKYGDLEISLSRNVTPRFGPEVLRHLQGAVQPHNLADESPAKPAIAKGGEHEPPRASEEFAAPGGRDCNQGSDGWNLLPLSEAW